MQLGPYQLAVATDFGPRITSLQRDGSPDFFAHLGEEVVLPYSPSRVYRLRGGHRLWAAPEIPELTYAPDDHACEIVATAGSVRILAPVDDAGLIKSISVSPDGEILLADHRLTNGVDEILTVAPWAITQVRLGGMAELPLATDAAGTDLQADRSLVLWPYTDLTDPRLSFGADRVRVQGSAGPGLKVGSGPAPVELSYTIEGWRFTKRFEWIEEARYTDLGAVGQVFVKDAFLELETLGPLTRLEPGQSVDHREVWEIRSLGR